MGQYYDFGDQVGPLLQQVLSRQEQAREFDAQQAKEYIQMQNLMTQHKESMIMQGRGIDAQNRGIDVQDRGITMQGRGIDVQNRNADAQEEQNAITSRRYMADDVDKHYTKFVDENTAKAYGVDLSTIPAFGKEAIEAPIKSIYKDAPGLPSISVPIDSNNVTPKDWVEKVSLFERGGKDAPADVTSSTGAQGYMQFTGGTWLDKIYKHRPDVVTKTLGGAMISRDQIDDFPEQKKKLLDLRSDIDLSKELGGALAGDNYQYLMKNGAKSTTGGDLYLAHNVGAGDAIKIINADPQASIASLGINADSIAVNPAVFKNGVTAGALREWANKNFGENDIMTSADPSAPTTREAKWYDRAVLEAASKGVTSGYTKALTDQVRSGLDTDNYGIEGMDNIPVPSYVPGGQRLVSGEIPVANNVSNQLLAKMQMFTGLSKGSLNEASTMEYLRKQIPALFEGGGTLQNVEFNADNNSIKFQRKYEEPASAYLDKPKVDAFINNDVPLILKSIARMKKGDVAAREEQLLGLGRSVGQIVQLYPEYMQQLQALMPWYFKDNERRTDKTRKELADETLRQQAMMNNLIGKLAQKDPDFMNKAREKAGLGPQ